MTPGVIRVHDPFVIITVSPHPGLSLVAPQGAPAVAQTFTTIVEWLRRAAMARLAGEPARLPLMLLLWGRLRRLVARFAALAIRAEAGRGAPRPRPTRPRPVERPPPAGAPPKPRERLPEGFGWLVRLVPEARSFGSQLEHLLRQPEMAALLESAPQAGRLLRPLCRMLGVRPEPPLALPRRPPRPARPRRAVPKAKPLADPHASLPPLPWYLRNPKAGLASLRLPRNFKRG